MDSTSAQPDIGSIFPAPRADAIQYPIQPEDPNAGRDQLYPPAIDSGTMSTHTNSFVPVEQELPREQSESRESLSTAEETIFMQVFVEEVGVWMDSMDPMKHFSRLLPFHSLSEPMLLNAFLACGARHLTLINPAYSEEKALDYYDTDRKSVV